jgi:DnaJ-class molecular chaperone
MTKAKDPYLVLGVPRDAGIEEVKRAYRRLVLALHPDRSQDSQGTDQLRDVQRAYETLQDPASRSDYDLSQRDPDKPVRSEVQRGDTPPESLTYATWRHEVRFRPEPFATGDAEIAQRARQLFTEVDEALGGVVPEVFPNRPASVNKDLFVEVMLTESEARVGGTFPLAIPVQKQCRACLGSGLGSLTQSCATCGGRGYHTEKKELELVVPAGVSHGQQTSLSITTGEKPVTLRVLVRVV